MCWRRAPFFSMALMKPYRGDYATEEEYQMALLNYDFLKEREREMREQERMERAEIERELECGEY